MRLKPRYNPEVNQWWLCDEGRYGYKFIDDPSRILQPQIKKDGEFVGLSWKQAIEQATQKLGVALQERGKDSVIVVASPQLTNEDLFVIRRFFGEDLGLSQIDFRVPDKNPKTQDDFLLRADKNPNTQGAMAIISEDGGFSLAQFLKLETERNLSLLYLFEQDLIHKLGETEAKRFLRQFDTVIYQGSNENETSVLADLVLPSATYAETEGTFTNFEGRVQRINRAIDPLGDSLPTWQIVAKLAQALSYDYFYEYAEEIFADLAQRVTEFEDLTHEKIGDNGAMLNNTSRVQV